MADLKKKSFIPDPVFQKVMGALREGVLIMDHANRVAYCNPALEKTLETRAEDAEGKPLHEAFTGVEADALQAQINRVRKSREPAEFEITIAVFGKTIHIAGRCTPGDDTAREGVVCSLQDCTESKKIQQQLANSLYYNRQISENTPIGIYVFDCNTMKVVYGNKTYFDFLGYSLEEIQSHGLGIVELIYHPDDYERLNEHDKKLLASRDGEVQNYEARIIPKDGDIKWAIAREMVLSRNEDGSPAQTLCTFTDITEYRKTEEALRRTQRLDSLGKLAAGIAHDFNNLLGGVYGYAQLASNKSADPAVCKDLSMALTTIDRARHLTSQLLTFAKGGEPVRKTGSLSPLIRQTAEFALCGSSTGFSCEISENLWPCNFDKHQIGQVIENLVINARQAMFAGGRLILAAKNCVVHDHDVLDNGDFVRLSVIDNGPGISAAMQAHIFDPFFTTKTDGHGLGLSTSYSIVKRHGGCIELESAAGAGAAFHVYLPAAPGAAIQPATETEMSHRGSGTVLVMDDEPVLRAVLRDMLAMLGYETVCKENGESALEYFIADRHGPRQLAAAVLDLTVREGMGGLETAAAFRKIDSGIPLFMASGYAEHPVIARPTDYGFTASIRKPFKIHDISTLFAAHLSAPAD